jgi:hypothetical protein
VDLTTLDATGLRVGMTNVSDAWLLDWARLFSQRIPAGERPGGTMAGSVLFASARRGRAASWQGEFHGGIDGVLPWKDVESEYLVHPVSVTTSADGVAEFVLTPFVLTPPGKTPALTLTGTATRSGLALTLMGTATEAQVRALRALAPPLGDGLSGVLGTDGVAARVMKVDVTCTRAWGSGQTCAAGAAVAPKRRRRR